MSDSRFDPDENPPPPERRPYRAPRWDDPVTPDEMADWLDRYEREHKLGKYRQKRRAPEPLPIEPTARGEGVFGTGDAEDT